VNERLCRDEVDFTDYEPKKLCLICLGQRAYQRKLERVRLGEELQPLYARRTAAQPSAAQANSSSANGSSVDNNSFDVRSNNSSFVHINNNSSTNNQASREAHQGNTLAHGNHSSNAHHPLSNVQEGEIHLTNNSNYNLSELDRIFNGQGLPQTNNRAPQEADQGNALADGNHSLNADYPLSTVQEGKIDLTDNFNYNMSTIGELDWAFDEQERQSGVIDPDLPNIGS
jgi:hypothetical protein